MDSYNTFPAQIPLLKLALGAIRHTPVTATSIGKGGARNWLGGNISVALAL